jgi:hypothetical protein
VGVEIGELDGQTWRVRISGYGNPYERLVARGCDGVTSDVFGPACLGRRWGRRGGGAAGEDVEAVDGDDLKSDPEKTWRDA